MSRVLKQLSELGNIVTGKTPSTSNSELWDGEIPFITPTDIKGFSSYYQGHTERTVSEYGATKQAKTILPRNSVCVSCIATIGKMCLTDCKSITNQQINSIIPNEQNDYRYILYMLRYNLPYIQLVGGGSGSGTPIISKNKFSRFKFIVEDDLQKQRRIASILSAYDNLIENNNKRIRLLEQMAENLYKEWFVRFRFPGHEKAEFENGLPKGWKVMKLYKLLNVRYGKDHSKIEDGNIPIIGSGGIMRYGNKELYASESVLIPRKGSLNNIMYMDEPFWTVDTMFFTEMKYKNIAKYVYYVLSEMDMESFNSGAALPSMTTNILNHFKVILPSEDILALFDEKVGLLFSQIKNFIQQNGNLSRQRDLLLPRLMSGKLEV